MQLFKAAKTSAVSEGHCRQDHCGPPRPPWREDPPQKVKKRFKQLAAATVIIMI